MLEIEQLAVSRGAATLFSGLSFELGAGQVMQIHGANGAGKTSLLRAICGLGSVDSGSIRWQGKARDAAFRASLRYIDHQIGIKRELTPAENLTSTAALYGIENVDIDRLLHRIGLLDRADIPCGKLSAGQQRRTAMGRLLIGDSQLWILDEPFASLDVDGQRLLSELMAAQAGAGGAILFTAHHHVDVPGVSVTDVHLSEFCRQDDDQSVH